MFAKESIDLLKQRIDLVDVVSVHIPLQRAGSALKACCPFHDEKTPSFTIQRGDTHYHCYGCGAHGDAIAFLMGYLKMNFVDALEYLADRYGVLLEKQIGEGYKKTAAKSRLKEALELACQFYHFSLIHTEQGKEALQYLYGRGITLDFISTFQIGYAPQVPFILRNVLKERGITHEVMMESGLITEKRDFFQDRITFPIRDGYGAVIGFSARKFKEETYGGKYINTPETPLFKKAHVLYGLSYCRQEIAKGRRVLIVEGQLDALRLIHQGFNWTVAGQGTAFGAHHVQQLIQLGVNRAYLALDGDLAGKEAAVKIGHLFQKQGIEVTVLDMPPGKDPDQVLREEGPQRFTKRIEEGRDYLTFLFQHLSAGIDLTSPSQKSELVTKIAMQIRSWDLAVMVHESLRKLAEIACVPQEVVGVGLLATMPAPVRKTQTAGSTEIDPDRIIEADLLRWLFMASAHDVLIAAMIQLNITKDFLLLEPAKYLFDLYFSSQGTQDLLSLSTHAEDLDSALFLAEILSKKINVEKAYEGTVHAIYKILEREWMKTRAELIERMQKNSTSEEETLQLVKEFDLLKKQPPQVQRV